jgi:hypothetical protein
MPYSEAALANLSDEFIEQEVASLQTRLDRETDPSQKLLLCNDMLALAGEGLMRAVEAALEELDRLMSA